MIDWDKQPLGKMPDTELGIRLGVSQSAVCKQRQRRLIPPYGKGVDWRKQPLGKYSDNRIARALRVSVVVVAAHREAAGIPKQKKVKAPRFASARWSPKCAECVGCGLVERDRVAVPCALCQGTGRAIRAGGRR